MPRDWIHRVGSSALRRVFAIVALATVLSGTAHAQFTWTGGGGDGDWSTAANWDAAVPANSFSGSFLFNVNTNLNTNNDLTGGTVTGGGGGRSLFFNTGAGAFVLTGNQVTLSGNVESRSSNNPVVDLDLVIDGTRTLTARNGGGLIVDGDISETGGSRELRVSSVVGLEGTGVTLSGDNSYTGDTRVFNPGLLTLDFNRAGAPTSDIVNAGSRLRLTGGRVDIAGSASGNVSQTFDDLFLDGQQSSALRVTEVGGNQVDVILGDYRRDNASRSRLDFTLPTTGSITTTTNATVGANDLLNNSNGGSTAFATVGGTTWATNAGGAGTIGALADGAYQVDSFAATTGDTDIQNSLAPATFTTNTLRFNAGADTLTLAGNNSLGAGGILVTAAGSGSQIVGPGTLSSGGQEIMIINEAASFTVGAAIGDANDRLTISGAGATILTGDNNNLGRETSVHSGALLDIRHANALGIADGTNGTGTTVVSGGVIQLQGGIAVGNERLRLQGSGLNGDGTGALRSVSGNNSWGGEIETQTFDTRIVADAGTFTLGGPITSNTDGTNNRSVNFGGAGDIVVNGVIGGLGSGAVIKHDSGTLTLNGANTYTGSATIFTDVLGGTLRTGNDDAFGTSEVRLANTNSTLEVADGVDVGNDITIRNNGGNKEIGLQAGATSGTFSGDIEIQETTAGNFDVSAGNNGELIMSGNITSTGNAGVTKVGAGTVILSGTNSYTGTTNVSNGTLIINGDNSGATGAVTVADGASLGGTGIIGGGVTVADGATIAPGNSIGTLSQGNTVWNGGSFFEFEFNGRGDGGSGSGTAGTNWDQLNITGTLDLVGLSLGSPVTVNLLSRDAGDTMGPANIAGWNSTTDYQWTFVTTTGGITGFNKEYFAIDTSGFIDTIDMTNPYGFVVKQQGNNLVLFYTAVPEPGTVGVLVALLSGLAFRRKRRRIGVAV